MTKLAVKYLNAIYLQLRSNEKGLTTVEYAVAGGLVAATLVVAFTDLGDATRGVIEDLTAALTGGTP